MIPFMIPFFMFFRALYDMLKNPELRVVFYIVGITLASGTVFYHNIEGWGWLDSLYFSVITLTTVGYGDLSPSTDIGKIFTMVYIFVGLGILIGFITVMGERIADQRVKLLKRKNR